ncbi:SpoIIE family protein phosphatase [Nonomuraea rubra]|uniref:SpoIIE family protein phosphatase n=1 Tax=Nonomuraea rubra TaxID=46180 RepID=UPI0031E99641
MRRRRSPALVRLGGAPAAAARLARGAGPGSSWKASARCSASPRPGRASRRRSRCRRAATLLLYTDGLVERPGEHLDEGLERLRRLAESVAGEPVDRFCDSVVSGLPTSGLDDIAVIALRVPAEPPSLCARD